MNQREADLKAELLARYSVALDTLLEESEGLEDFAELEEAVSQLAERTLPQTLSALQASKAFSPSVSRLPTKSAK